MQMLQVVRLNGLAALVPHACPNMLLRWVKFQGEAPIDVRIHSDGRSGNVLTEEAVLEVIKRPLRPVTLTFEHPWQRFVDEVGGGEYYYNSITDESVWQRPPEIEKLLAASQAQLPSRQEAVKSSTTAVSLTQMAEDWQMGSGCFTGWSADDRAKFAQVVVTAPGSKR